MRCVDHTGVVVTDLDAATDFFATWLGATVVFRLDRVDDPSGAAPARLGGPHGAAFALVMLELENTRLELVRWWLPGAVHDSPDLGRPYAMGAAHVAIGVEDVQTELDRLRAAPGVEVISTPLTFNAGPTQGLTNAFLRMSWGLLLELVSPESSGFSRRP